MGDLIPYHLDEKGEWKIGSSRRTGHYFHFEMTDLKAAVLLDIPL